MPQLNYEQRQRLFNYFAEAHDLLLLEDDFRFIDDLIYSQNSGKPLVSGSLPPQSAFDEALEKEAFRVPYDGSKNFYDHEIIKHWKKCWNWVNSWRQ